MGAILERKEQQILRLERISQISARYQTDVQERVHHLSQRYDLQFRKLEKASTHHQLTGLPNRQLIVDRCRREDDRTQRDNTT